MTKAEERAREYANTFRPEKTSREDYLAGYEQAEKDLADAAQFSSGLDGFFYGKGYEQAKKDLALTWEDIESIVKIADSLLTGTAWDVVDWPDEQKYFEEVLKRFKEAKK